MRHEIFRTVLRSTVGAVILMPALAVAQGNTSSPSGQGTQGGGSQTQDSASQDSRSQHSGAKRSGSEETTKQGNASGSAGSQGSAAGMPSSPSQTDPMAGSQSPGQQSGAQSGSASSTGRQSIDPAEVQRVFGTDATLVNLQTLGPEQIRSVQQSLQDRGLYKGAIDGVYGPQTRAGLKAMLNQQHSLNQRLISQGQVTGPLAASMGIQQSDIAPVAGSDAPTGQGSGIRTQPSTPSTQAMPPSGMQPSGSSTGSPTTGSSSGSGRSTGSPSGSSNSGSAGSSGSTPGGSGTQYPR